MRVRIETTASVDIDHEAELSVEDIQRVMLDAQEGLSDPSVTDIAKRRRVGTAVSAAVQTLQAITPEMATLMPVATRSRIAELLGEIVTRWQVTQPIVPVEGL
jgi:hypothetical protein